MRLVMNNGHAHPVYGVVVNGGEEFEVPDNEGVTWIKLGYARKATGPSRNTIINAALEAKQEEEPRRRKRYSRSDMRAEDDE